MTVSQTVAASPYRGLVPFGDSDLDALFFFGREREIEVIAANLLAARLTVLYGPSGVGKSSVLRAGVVRSLRAVSFPRAVVVFDTWADNPVRLLAEKVAAAAGVSPRDSLVETLADAGAALDGEVYLVLDQFEEYFVYHGAERGPGSFVAELGSAVTATDVHANVLLCLREDALAKLDILKNRVPGLFSNYLRLDHLDRDAARRAIVAPVDRWNELFGRGAPVLVEPELVEAVLEQVETGKLVQGGSGRGTVPTSGRPGFEAPYLQLVLERLWEVERSSNSGSLRLSTLETLGGAESIVGDHLEQALLELAPAEQETAAAIFHHLVTPSGSKIAHTLDDLARYAALDESRVRVLVERLVTERVLRPVAGPSGAKSRYEIFHDVLAGPVLEWRTKLDARRAEASARRAAEARHRRTVIVAAVVFAVLLVVTGIAIFALVQRREARNQARQAHASELAARAVVEQPVDPSGSLARALEAAQLDPTAQTEAVLRSSLIAARLRRVLETGSPVRAVAYAPNGRLVAVGSADGRVRLWDPTRNSRVRTFDAGGAVSALGYQPHGSMLLAVGGGTATLWNTANGRRHAIRSSAPIVDAALSRDGVLLATAGSDGASIWRTVDGTLVRRIRASGLARRVVVAADGATIGVVRAAAGGRITASTYDARTGRLLHALPQRGVKDIEFAPRGNVLATGSADGTVALWQARTGVRLHLLDDGGRTGIRDLAFSPDGTMLATASSDAGIRVWRVADGSRFFFFVGHTSPAVHVAFAPSGDYVVSTSEDRTARIWAIDGIEAGKQAALLAGSRDIVSTATFSPDGRTVITGGEDGAAREWDARIEQQLIPVQDERAPVDAARVRDHSLVDVVGGHLAVRSGSTVLGSFAVSQQVMALNADGSVVASAAGRTVTVQQTPTGGRIAAFAAPSTVTALAFSFDGGHLVAATRTGTVLIWNVDTRVLEHHFGAERGIARVAVSARGDVVLTGDVSGVARLWSPDGTLRHVLREHVAAVTDARFDPSGQRAITASEGAVRNVAVWDVPSGRLQHVLIGHFGTVTAASFSADGRWIVTAGPISAGVWPVDTGQLLFYLRGPRDLLTDAEWAPAGYRIVTAGRDGLVREYQCELCRPLADLETLAGARLAATQ